MTKRKKELEQWGPIDSVILYNSFWFLPLGGATNKKWHIRWPNMMGVMDHSRVTFYWEKEEMYRYAKDSVERWLLPDTKFKRLHRDYWRLHYKLTSVSASLKNALQKPDKKKLIPLVENWFKTYNEFWTNTAVFELANYAAPRYLESLLREFVPHASMPHVLETLLAPELLSFHQQSEMELMQIKAATSPANTKSKLEKYAKKWYWVNNSYYEQVFLDSRYFDQRLHELTKTQSQKKLQALKQYPKDTRAAKKELLKKYRIPLLVNKIAGRLSYSIWWQDHRKAKVWEMNALLTQLNCTAETIFDVPENDLTYYGDKEWLDLWRKNTRLPHTTVAERKKFCAIPLGNNTYTIYTGKIARWLARPYIVNNDSGDIVENSISGIVVSKGSGQVTGTVRIVHSPRQSNLFQKGEILVATMTSPDFVPVMRKAKAIITDVGGLMSHAAVVSRELKVPCIVNTKIGTKVLKDGMKVSVDPTKGTVTILKK